MESDPRSGAAVEPDGGGGHAVFGRRSGEHLPLGHANHSLVGRPALGIPGGELRIPDDRGVVGQVIQIGRTPGAASRSNRKPSTAGSTPNCIIKANALVRAVAGPIG